MKDNNGAIKIDKFTIKPISIEEVISFLNRHLSKSLIEVVNIEHYIAACKVKTADGEKIVSISLPVQYFNNKKP